MNVGSSEEPGCEDYAKGVFLLNHGDKFYCPRCRHLGTVVKETGHVDRGDRDDAPFKEVRVEFNYDPTTKRFLEIAIVRDEAIWGTGSKYTLLSPLIKTEKRALKVAESVLANLQRYAELSSEDEIPRSTEVIISLDDDAPVFSRKMKALGKSWEESSLAQERNTARSTKSQKPPEIEQPKAGI
jgi:hypothetical protein